MNEFIYTRKVRLKDTDATGVLYFSEQLKMALEAFEEFLAHHQFSLRQLIDSPYLMPIVHAEADYFAPVMVGDELEIGMSVEAIGTKSMTLQYRFYDATRKLEVGKAKIVHVTVERASRASVPIPDFMKAMLEELAMVVE